MLSPFLELLKTEVGKMQITHPEREGEIARAHALILHGMVLPSADDPATGQVLSSDGVKHYTVNGSCSCQAGQHGQSCKHLHSWRLYRHIEKKLAAQAAPVETQPAPLPEAPASVNVRLQVHGREVQWTLRDTDEARLATRLEALLARYPLASPQGPTHQGQPISPQQYNAAAMHKKVTDFCPIHSVQMEQNFKDGRSWFSHKTADGWCKGK